MIILSIRQNFASQNLDEDINFTVLFGRIVYNVIKSQVDTNISVRAPSLRYGDSDGENCTNGEIATSPNDYIGLLAMTRDDLLNSLNLFIS